MSEPSVICSACKEEVQHALVCAQQAAVKSGNLMYVVQDGLFFWLADERPAERKALVAECYPGGRVIIWRDWA